MEQLHNKVIVSPWSSSKCLACSLASAPRAWGGDHNGPFCPWVVGPTCQSCFFPSPPLTSALHTTVVACCLGFILIRVECPYVQFAAAHVISIEKRFIVGGINGRERDRSQVSDGKVERTPRARLLLGCVLCVENNQSKVCRLSGVPCPLFYRPRGAGIIDGRKRKNQR